MVFLDSVHILNSYIVHFWKCSFPTFCNLNSNKNFLAFLHFTRDSKNILKAEIKPMFIIVVLLGVKIGSTNSQAGFKILNSVSTNPPMPTQASYLTSLGLNFLIYKMG